ncbi:hypothetical protein [Candidatus Entotheonella palauensis]|uniref:Uncharacterized protein n=1 Tax=Candidatus Entotheonella gemina TaxID=1429439 RepID=W4M1A5_9BACT|nr:hypothetical protein [Candidatus Entotheonella palauensis]ETX03970.1 MAG: hypothetical protein ETSY2_31505 [Candidatus Entotheonella gemina]
MFTLRMKYALYGLLFLGGLASLAFASYQQHYSRLITTGHRAVAEQRFDSRDYERASQLWLASQDRLSFNRGVLAYKAQNLPRAAQFFRQVSQDTTSAALRVQALHNLGMVMVALKEAQGAAHMFKEALRLNPEDMRSKFHLERLYHFVLQSQSKSSEASVQQAPGNAKKQGQQPGQDGQGRGSADKGI